IRTARALRTPSPLSRTDVKSRRRLSRTDRSSSTTKTTGSAALTQGPSIARARSLGGDASMLMTGPYHAALAEPAARRALATRALVHVRGEPVPQEKARAVHSR